MGIKEIALKHSREYLTFKLGGRKGLDVAEIVCDDEIYAEIVDELAQQFEALISAYKVELLKEVGEPVLYAEFAEDGGWLGDASEYADHLEEPHALFTSDQVAAAIIKATKPLEERRCEICGYAEHHREHTGCLRTQLAAAQEEINEWRGKHDVACLTITKLQKQYEIQLAATSKAMGAEESLLIVNYQLAKAEQLWQVAQGRCDGLEEKLAKAEQRVAEWQPIETAPKDGTDMLCCGWRYNQPKNDWFHTVCWWNGHGFVDDSGYVDFVTHWMPLPKAPNDESS